MNTEKLRQSHWSQIQSCSTLHRQRAIASVKQEDPHARHRRADCAAVAVLRRSRWHSSVAERRSRHDVTEHGVVHCHDQGQSARLRKIRAETTEKLPELVDGTECVSTMLDLHRSNYLEAALRESIRLIGVRVADRTARHDAI
ncbi:hypothetical protein FI667_g1324, partial [Globisporangium splendens]